MSVTKIEWTNKVWNPVRGCSRVSEGCRNCYAERQAIRQVQGAYAGLVHSTTAGPRWTGAIALDEAKLEEPLHWRKPCRVFVNSMSDLFHEAVPDLFIKKVLCIIAASPQHTFQILTKRPFRMMEFFAGIGNPADSISSPVNHNRAIPQGWDFDEDFENRVANAINEVLGKGFNVGWPMKNLWLGVSVEDQKTADERIPLLLQTPAAVRWISAEPLLGPIDLTIVGHEKSCGFWRVDALTGEDRFPGSIRKGIYPALDWIVVGGESGPNARPMAIEWARSIMQQCKAAGVPFFMKQGSKANWPDFKNFESFPSDLQVREYPEVTNASR